MPPSPQQPPLLAPGQLHTTRQSGAVVAGNLPTAPRLLPHAQLPGLDYRTLVGRGKRAACSAAEEGSEGARERGRERARTAAAPADIPVSARWRERKRFIVHLGLTTSSDCPALVSCFGARTCADALHQLAFDRQLLRGRVRRLRRREPVW